MPHPVVALDIYIKRATTLRCQFAICHSILKKLSNLIMATKSFFFGLLFACFVGISRHQYLGRTERLPLYDYFRIRSRQSFDAPSGSSYGSYLQPFRKYEPYPWRVKQAGRVPLPYDYLEEPQLEDSIILNHPEDESETLFRSGFKNTKLDDKASGRFLLANVDNVGYNAEASASPLFGNPFVKTVFYYITSYITDTAVAKCIPSTLFTSFNAQQIPCRRKRDEAVLDRVAQAEREWDNQHIESSSVVPFENSIAPSLGLPEAEKSYSFSPVNHRIQSSKEATLPGEFVNKEKAREKRFWYFVRNYFTVPTTVTTFLFTTTTYTSAIRMVATTDLTCLPVGYSVCQF